MEENIKNNKRTHDEEDKPQENLRSHSDMIDTEVLIFVSISLSFPLR